MHFVYPVQKKDFPMLELILEDGTFGIFPDHFKYDIYRPKLTRHPRWHATHAIYASMSSTPFLKLSHNLLQQIVFQSCHLKLLF